MNQPREKWTRPGSRDLITLLLIGWIIAFAGFLLMDRKQHGHWPPAAEVLHLAAITTLL